MTRATQAASALLEFWPCEDASGSTQVANAVEGGQPMVIGGSTPSFGTSMAPGTTSGLTFSSDSGLHGFARQSSATTFSVQFLANVAAASAARLFAVTMTGGTYPLWVLAFFPAGGVDTWGLQIFDGAGTQVVLNTLAFSINGVDEPYGRDLYFMLDLRQNGGNVEYEFRAYDYTQGAASGATGSYAGTLGHPDIIIAPSPSGEVGIGSGTKYAQIALLATSSNFAAWAPADSYDATSYLDGFTGEDPADRLFRLCAENSIDLVIQGTSSGRGVTMGPQGADTLYNLIYECVDVDQGVLFETRTQLGFTYRCASSLYNQTAVALDYAQAHLSDKLQSKPDELYIRNSVTAARKNGSSVTVQDMTSRLSTSEPPNGVGLYDRGTATVNCRYDADLTQLAYWLLALGTIDEPRYPAVTVELHRSQLLASTSLSQQVVGIDSGDYFTISNPPVWLPQFDIECLTLGYTETLAKFRWAMTFATRPGAPWRVIALDSATGNQARADFYGQTLNGAHNSSTTSLSVATASPYPLITTAAGDVPFDIEITGERITVTAVSGAASPQTLTVTRSVNGVVKSHLTGESVSLWRPNTLAY
jgi:hypothetical protein